MSQYDSTTKIWSGPKVNRNEDNSLSFRENVLKCLRSSPEKVFQICDDDGSELTFSQVEEMSIRVARNLQKIGVKPKDVISVFFKNTAIVAPIVFGCTLIGAPINPITCRMGVNNGSKWLKFIFDKTRPSVIIMDDCSESHELLAQALNDIGLNPKIFLVGQEQSNFSENLLRVGELFKETGDEKAFELSANDGVGDESLVIVVPSSGTTDTPKSVSLSGTYCKGFKHIWFVDPIVHFEKCNYLKTYRQNREGIVCFSFSTISWITGIACLWFPLLNNGLRVISTEEFSPKSFGRIAKKYQVSVTITSSQKMSAMYGSPDFNPDDFASFKELMCGGERVPTAVREYFKRNLPNQCFGVGYGASECSIVSNFELISDTSSIKDNIVGGLFANVRCKVIDISSGTPLGPNKVGEFFTVTDMMMSNYYNNPELTAKVFDGCWYKTGDVGYFDENGFMHVHGRIVDMITINGELVHPVEIEESFEAIDGIRSACVVNITEANLLAVLCTRMEDSTITEADLKSKASSVFKNLKFNGGIYIVKELPRTITNSCKVHRGDTRKLAMKLMTFRNENNYLLNDFE